MMRRLVSALCCCILLAACSVGPDYVRPPAVAVMPDQFKELPGWKRAATVDGALQGAWWRCFHDQELDRLMGRLAVSNQTLRQAEAQYHQARALLQAARSGSYPTVTLGAAATRAQRSANAVTGVKNGGASPGWDLQLPLDLSWELDLWGRIRRTVEAGEAGATASADDLAAARLSLQASLAVSYFQLRTVDAQRVLYGQTVDGYRRYLELTRNRYQAGVAAQSDLLQAETQLKSIEAQAVDLDLQRAQLEHAVALLIGTPASHFSLPLLPLAGEPPEIPAVIPSQLLEKRPDIAAAERRMMAANAQIGVAQAAWFPTVRLSATGGLESSSLASWLAWPSRFWSVGPSVSQTLFDGGLRGAQTAQARAVYEGTVAAYRQTVLTAFQEVEDNLAALRLLATEGAMQAAAVEAAHRTTIVTSNQYQAGVAGYLNVITAQTAELANRRTALSIQGRRLVADVLLIKAIGGGWEGGRRVAAGHPSP